ncbi:aminomethyl-transferring glycine dehydrogenase subunit GcvPA [Eilatimonas milleporae]|uniref:Probable glycine dehydrogenase (decarboxylating) subunit 1 n=1 Tax=Eilatimonas milleporae TaxID=911205 RepID=A0A3M0C459_9PROT|nr:aminomethyl-transferring glycine dehydrogenase subunit GcvPA [Eilatimonas milleporae]RMB04641.1 glycine dehydrogenase (decarboxylating) alpha subunit [Eilatimonas milleporae]
MRYLPLKDADRSAMLTSIGVSHIDDLFRDVPDGLLNPAIDLPDHQSELAVERHLGALARRNHAAGDGPFFLGAGAYRHHVPATVDHLIQRGEFLTAYTPYQPEIAQGTLQYLFEFQTQVAALTGMDVANASLYDGSTACGEAILMARRVTRRKRAVLSGNLHGHYRAVAETMTRFTDDELVLLDPDAENPAAMLAAAKDAIDDRTSCVVVQTPDVFGHLHDLTALSEAAHEKGALVIVVVTEAVSFGALTSPGAMGADIVVGEGQSIGNGLNYGGPYLGLFATRDKYLRQMPGRLCGETVDSHGKRGYVLTLSTREQHIRREKATSNICTNSGLCALAFTVHMALLGGAGLKRLARLNHAKACRMADTLAGVPGVTVLNTAFFNEVTVRLDRPAAEVADRLAAQGILAGVPASRLFPAAGLDTLLILAATETVPDEDIAALGAALKEALQ